MHLSTLRLRNFRNHAETDIEFGEGANVLLGDNGQGKTNTIEAISYLCLTKSFHANADALSVMFGHDMFEVEGVAVSGRGDDHRVRVVYQQSTGQKVFSIDRLHIEPLSSVIGRFPIVISSPDHSPITSGGPVERRKFVDFIISQSSAVYFETLLEYRRVVRHRNKILLDARVARRDPGSLLIPWDEQLVKCGGYLMMKRNKFVAEFHECITSAFHRLVGSDEEPAIEYQPGSPLSGVDNEEGFRALLEEELRIRNHEEKRVGNTLVGPHRDEFALSVNGLDLRKFASQGQHKTFLVALKIGEFFYLKERCQETPIMLLDDIFTELDEHRGKRLLNFVSELGQTFITTTNPHYFDDTMPFGDRNRIFLLQEGHVRMQSTVAA